MQNKLSVTDYLLLHIAVLPGAILLYRNTIFLTIRRTDLQQSLWIFWLVIVALTVGGIAFTMRSRTLMNCGGNVTVPFAAYTFLAYGSRNSIPAALWAALGVSLAVCAFQMTMFFTDRDRPASKVIASWLAQRIRNILAVLLGITLLSSAFLSAVHHGNVLAKAAASSVTKPAYSVYTDDEFRETQPELSRLYGNKERSIQETQRLLQLIVDTEVKYWGLPYTVSVEILPLDSRLYAHYYHAEKLITVNERTLMEPDVVLLHVILHEFYHSVESARVDAYQQVDAELRSARFFQREYFWAYEFEHYYSEGAAYSAQAVEEDAEAYADIRSAEYLAVLSSSALE